MLDHKVECRRIVLDWWSDPDKNVDIRGWSGCCGACHLLSSSTVHYTQSWGPGRDDTKGADHMGPVDALRGAIIILSGLPDLRSP